MRNHSVKKFSLCLAFLILGLHFQVYSQVSLSAELEVNTLEINSYRHKLTRISLLAGAGAMLALSLDETLKRRVVNNQSQELDHLAGGANFFGEKYFVLPVVALGWSAGYWMKDDRLKYTSWNAIKAIAVTAVATEALKIAAGRARPYANEGAFSFTPFSNVEAYKSLPSGHVSLAFAAFTPYAETYSRWLYAIPASVAFARIYKNKHWFSDTIIGGSLGFISAWIFTHHPKSRVQISGNGLIAYF